MFSSISRLFQTFQSLTSDIENIVPDEKMDSEIIQDVNQVSRGRESSSRGRELHHENKETELIDNDPNQVVTKWFLDRSREWKIIRQVVIFIIIIIIISSLYQNSILILERTIQ